MCQSWHWPYPLTAFPICELPLGLLLALAFLLLFVSVPECLSMSVSSSLPFFPHPDISPSFRALLAAQESLALMGSGAYQAL